MTIDAVKTGIEVPLAMTFSTQLSTVPPDEHESVGGPMGGMTDTASLFFQGKMFENPRASLLRVAVEAGFLLPVNARLSQTSPFTGSVRSMTL